MPLTIDLPRARAHWYARQGISGPPYSDPAEVIAQTGWLRTVGGLDCYLALRSRMPGFRRMHLEQAVGERRVRQVPAVRGCIYVVPASDLPLALRTADLLSRKRIARENGKAGIDPAELIELGEAIIEAVEQGPLTTHQLRKALPEGAIRRLGEAGKKVGISSTLPPAIRQLEFAGRLERLLVDDRCDHEQYVWQRPKVPPALDAEPADLVELAPRLAERFFTFAGPATRDEFANWSGLGKRAALAGIKAAGLVPVQVTGYADEAWVTAADAERLARPGGVEPRVALLNFADNFLSLHADPNAFLDPAHAACAVESWGRGRKPVGVHRYLHARTIIDGDRLIGAWDYDPDAGAVFAVTFGPLGSAVHAALDAEVEALTAFLAGFGHGRSSSIDSPKAQRKRVANLRASSGVPPSK